MLNPYEGINWLTIQHLLSFNHTHGDDIQERFDSYYNAGVRHFPISNYTPSHPSYPLSEHFTTVPVDAIGCPNSEKVMTSDGGIHFSALGSTYASPGHHWDTEIDGPYLTWREKFNNVFEELLFADGGGVVIHHPKRNSRNNIGNMEMLDYDSRVLGIEAYNHRSERDYDNRGWALDLWDEILLTGRRCWGFFTPDEHSVWDIPNNYGLGRNVLLVPEFTEQAALKAYRDGQFYGSILGGSLKFTDIVVDGSDIDVTIADGTKIIFTAGKIVGTATATEEVVVNDIAGTYTFDDNTIYVRVTAESATDKIFSQPIMFKDRDTVYYEIKQRIKKKRFVLLN